LLYFQRHTPGMKAVEFWFEFASTYTYPAAMRIEELARARGIELRWQPFLLGPIFRDQGWPDSPFNVYPVKGRYMWRDLERICDELALEFKKPSQFPRNGLLAARVCCAFAGAAWVPSFVRKVYSANFAEDRDIADPEVVSSCLSGLLEDPAPTLSLANSDETKARLRQNTEQAKALGIFGSPSLVVEGELFWGNDRLDAALDWASRSFRVNQG
jgi:2-hydroxychromene-2-carboxylate isomerase